MAINDPVNNRQLYVKIPQDLRDALDARCLLTRRRRTPELVLALQRHLASPAHAFMDGRPDRSGKPVVLYGEIRAGLIEGLQARAESTLRSVTAEVILALEKHLTQPAEPLPPKPLKPRRPPGRPRKTPVEQKR